MIGPQLRFERVPPIPEPPFDSTSMLIDDRSGWRLPAAGGLAGVEVSACDGSLALAPSAAAQRSFAEGSGSFGGLVTPSNVAVTPGGDLLLVDRRSGRLKRFDPCSCTFVTLPCLPTGPAGSARDPERAGAIAVCGDHLYVVGAGPEGRRGRRVSVFLLPGLQPVGHLMPPAGTFPAWEPVAVACDRKRSVWVLDRKHGAIHHFARSRRVLGAIKGLDAPEQLTVDAHDRLFVVDRVPATGAARLRLFDATGREQPAPERVSVAAPLFPSLPLAISANGVMELGGLCTVDCPPATTTFDRDGDPVAAPAAVGPALVKSGSYVSTALDSRTRECQWHRVVIHGEMPPGTRVRVETFCADEEYDAGHVAGLAVWARAEIAAAPPSDAPTALDCLILSPPGRFLWLKLTLLGDGAHTPVVRALELEFPRLSSLRYLPPVFAAEPTSADFTGRFLSLFDTTLRGIERAVDTEARLFDPSATPAQKVGAAPVDFLTWLGSWVGITFDRTWPEARRRRFLKNAGRLFARRGTVQGLRQLLMLVLGWQPARACGPASRPRQSCCEGPLNCAPEPEAAAYPAPPLILEHFRLRRWLHLGTGRLGAQAMLWGERIVNRSRLDDNARLGATQLVTTPDPRRDPLHVYAHRFTVFVPACFGRDEGARKSMDNLLRRESPAHVQWDVAYVEPRFRIGVQSMLGFDSVIGELPAPARLGGIRLGGPTLVAGVRGGTGQRELRVGRAGRIGTGSRVT